jgi:hypothetical protein
MEHPVTLMFAGAAIGGTVATFFWWPHLAKAQRALAELRGRAAALGTKSSEQAARIDGLADRSAAHYLTSQKLIRAMETLHAASAQATMAGARKVIADALEQIRCMGSENNGD